MLYVLSYLIPISVYIGLHSQGLMSFFGVIFAFLIIPGVELLLPSKNYSALQGNLPKFSFDLVLYSQIPIQFFLLITFLDRISLVSGLEFWGYTSSFGIACGVIGINAAHELGHRRSKLEKLFAKLLLSTSSYTHFFVEHNYGHHRNVSSPQDPATARFNENPYKFWLRSIYGSFFSAWKITFRKHSGIGLLKSELFEGFYIQLATLGGIAYFFSLEAIVFFFLSSIFGILLLETVNYIEHYGLMRKKLKDSDRYEPVKAIHSWNSNHPLGRFILFELSRHSDHHHNSFKKYYDLESIENAPQMPTGYPGMMLLSLIPPAWFYVMNKKIQNI